MKTLKFYVLNCNMSTEKPEMINIFGSPYVMEDIKKFKKQKLNKKELKEQLNKTFMYTYWSKIQYEIELRPKFGKNELHYTDVYEQIKANLDLITDYVYDKIS